VIVPQHDAAAEKTVFCINMIRLKKRKIKKMKLRKRLRKNKILYMTIRKNIQDKKDKLFNMEQMVILRKAEVFDAEKHVKEILAAHNHEPIPWKWHGKPLFESIVMEKMFRGGYKHIPGFDDFSKTVKKK